MINAFLKYKSYGLACLPTAKDKLPSIPKGESWLNGWNNKSEYENSFGIGILCGNISGGLECLDFDNHFGDAKQVVSDFLQIEEVKSIYEKHKLPIQSTTSGGFHLLYRCSVITGNQKLANRPKYDVDTKKTKKDVLIETRGEGGYFCADPTPGYKIIRNDFSKIPHITPEQREILLSACMSFNTYAEVKKQVEENKDLPGSIYNNSPESLYEMKSSLIRAGWSEQSEGRWIRPGKKKGLSATLGKVAPGVFYNFSSSSGIFESNHAYSAFQVVALLDYNGDFKAFAKELAQRFNVRKETKNYQPEQRQEVKSIDQLDEILLRSLIDINIPVAKPPVIMRLKTLCGIERIYTRVFTLGNFSAIIGKSKAKKSFLATMFMACAVSRNELDNTFQSDLPASRPGVVLFDTEQSSYDAYVTAKRITEIAKRKDNFGSFDLREFSPIERCNLIDRFIEKASNGVSFIVIDGIADLANAINDEIEASRVVSLLMKWTKLYNIHICVLLHQNKNDNYATGHLGSAIMKKSECVISVTKDASDSTRSEVACEFIRGTMEFDKFAIVIDENGMPKVEQIESIPQEEPKFWK